MVDKVLLLRKLAELEKYVEEIKEYSDITLKEFCDDWKIQRIVERTLQMMIEICIDIAGHIISDKRYRVPKSYGDTFRVLNEENILNRELFETMEKIAKFRNIIVHHYDKVDAEIVIDILRRDSNGFLDYKDAIIHMLKGE